MRFQIFKIVLIVFSTLWLVACKPVVKLSDAQISVPNQFKHAGLTPKLFISERYWERFDDPILNELVDRALRQNSDLKLASYRLQRDFALAGVKFAEQFGHLSANPAIERLRSSLNIGQPIGQLGIPRDQTLYSFPLHFSYELDLWGRIRSQYDALKAESRASYYLYWDTQITLVNEVLKNYGVLRLNAKKAQILKGLLKVHAEIISIYRDKMQAGKAALDPVLLAEQQRLIIENEEIGLEAERAKLLTNLAILVGESPSHFEIQVKPMDLDAVVVFLPDLVPSVWIRHRPDIRAAEQQVLASNAMARSALADFFPKFTFNARLGFQSQSASNLFSQASQFFGFGPSVSIPLLDLGQILGQYRARKIEAHAALETYKKTVLTAFKDVEDRLIELHEAERLFRNFRKQIANRKALVDLAAARYGAGLADRSEVLLQQTEKLRAELLLVAQKRALIARNLDLIRSFGGGISDATLDLPEHPKEPASDGFKKQRK